MPFFCIRLTKRGAAPSSCGSRRAQENNRRGGAGAKRWPRTPRRRQGVDDKGRAQLGSLRTKLFYGFGSIAYGVKDAGFGALLLLYYNQVIGLPAQWWGTAIMIAPDIRRFRRSHRPGRFRTICARHGGDVIPSCMRPRSRSRSPTTSLWSPPHLSQSGMFVYLVVMAIIVRTFITMFEIPNSAMNRRGDDGLRPAHQLPVLSLFSSGVMGGAVMAFREVQVHPDARRAASPRASSIPPAICAMAGSRPS